MKVLVLLCLYDYEHTGSAVVFVRKVLRVSVGDTKNGIYFIGCWFLRLLAISVGFEYYTLAVFLDIW